MAHNYTVKFSKRRTLGIEITRDLTVLVRAPLHTGRQRIDQLVEENAGWIDAHLEKQRLRSEAHAEPSEEERAALRKKAQEVLPTRVTYYAGLMGLTPAAVTVTGAAKRFGSCSGKNRLSFSWRLMLYPDAAVDYVVVHELAHIVHHNHGRDFYALIEKYLPDYKERRRLLKG